MFAHEYDKLKFESYKRAVTEWKTFLDEHEADIDLLPVMSHDLGYSEKDISADLHELVRRDEPLSESDRFHLREAVRKQGKSAT